LGGGGGLEKLCNSCGKKIYKSLCNSFQEYKKSLVIVCFYILVIVGLNPKINLQTMPKTIVLCKIAEYETHGSEHEPCKEQNNKPAKFNGDV
jgi:hypothetical protein